jgi:hypothetical protein
MPGNRIPPLKFTAFVEYRPTTSWSHRMQSTVNRITPIFQQMFIALLICAAVVVDFCATMSEANAQKGT